MYKVIIENKYGEQLQLTDTPDYITKVTGLSPVTSNIITSPVANYGGERFVSSRKQKRNIVLTIYPQEPVETNRINLYKYIKSDDFIRVYYKNKTRDVYIDGYVESFDLDLFERTQRAQVSIICPQPNFIDMSSQTVDNSSTIKQFYCPFNTELVEGTLVDNELQFTGLGNDINFLEFITTPQIAQIDADNLTGLGEYVEDTGKYLITQKFSYGNDESTQFSIELDTPLFNMGDYADSLKCDKGEWYIERNVEHLTLDGSENWATDGHGSYSTTLTRSLVKGNLPVMCNDTTTEISAVSTGKVIVLNVTPYGLNRNLLTGSENMKFALYGGTKATTESNISVPEWGATDATRIYGTGGAYKIVLLKTLLSGVTVKGTSYTNSIYIKNNHATNSITVYNNLGSRVTLNAGEAKRVVLTGVGNGIGGLQYQLYTDTVGAEFDITYWHPKVEYGKVATDWSPAPEDVNLLTLLASNPLKLLIPAKCSRTEFTNTAVDGLKGYDTLRVSYLQSGVGDMYGQILVKPIVLGRVSDDMTVLINNYSDDEVGFIYKIHCTAEVRNPAIYLTETNEHIKLNGIFKKEDIITIDTRRGKKSITKTYRGKSVNIINYLDNTSKWLQLQSGYNHLIQTADEGSANLNSVIVFTNEYEGV